jgi:hypothetical protein
MTCRSSVHELGHEQPKPTKELLDIATRHVSGEEAVGAVFIQSGGIAVTSGDRGTSAATTKKGTKRGINNTKRGPKSRGHC